MSVRTAKILLALVILSRSCSLVFSKIALNELAPLQLLGWRFSLACLALGLIFHKKIFAAWQKHEHLLLKSFALGFAIFLCMACESISLPSTPVHTVAFLENMSLAIVPFMMAIVNRRLPRLYIMIGAVIILTGVGIMTMKGSTLAFTTGEAWALSAAFFYALFIVLTGLLTNHDNALALGVLQMGWLGLLSFISGAFLGSPLGLPQEPATWICLLFLIVVCSGFGFTLQPIVQQYVSAEETGMFCALNPLCESVLGALVFAETFGKSGLIGAAFILFGMVYVNYPRKAAAARAQSVKESVS